MVNLLFWRASPLNHLLPKHVVLVVSRPIEAMDSDDSDDEEIENGNGDDDDNGDWGWEGERMMNDDDDEISEGEDWRDDDEEESDDDDSVVVTVGDDDDENFIRTFQNGDYDAVFDKALSFDRKDDLYISLSVPPRQESYNKPDNWRERNRIGLTNVKEQLQKCIRNVEQSNSFTLDLEHNSEGPLFAVTYRSYRGQLRDNEEPIAWDENF